MSKNENDLQLLSYSTEWPRENSKLFHFKKTLLKWKKKNDEIFLNDSLLFQQYLMFSGEMDWQREKLGRKKW